MDLYTEIIRERKTVAQSFRCSAASRQCSRDPQKKVACHERIPSTSDVLRHHRDRGHRSIEETRQRTWKRIPW